MHTSVTPWRWLSRVLMLVCVAVGLATMHTMGHAGMAHRSATMAHSPVMAVAAAADTRPMPGPVDARPHLAAPPGTELPADGWAVCVAVLGGVALLALLVSALARFTRSGWPNRPRGVGVLTGTRAPPPRHGLRLADLSVMRR